MSESHDNIRKRVGKACDRCRLKKSKCDGTSPCNRCKTDNSICVFGERKKSHDKVYPKGYVEQLEQNQKQLTEGLRQLYTRLQRGEGWDGPPLQEAPCGFPLTHDILDALDILRPTREGEEPAPFEEDFAKMQEKLSEKNPPSSTHREGSVSEASGAGADEDQARMLSCPSYGGSPTTRSTPSIKNFYHNNMAQSPPSPLPSPNFIPHPAAIPRAPIKQQAYTYPPQSATGNPMYEAEILSGPPTFGTGMYGDPDFLSMGPDYSHNMFAPSNPFTSDPLHFAPPEFDMGQHGTMNPSCLHS